VKLSIVIVWPCQTTQSRTSSQTPVEMRPLQPLRVDARLRASSSWTCDLVLLALGCPRPRDDTGSHSFGWRADRRGNVKAGPDYQTTVPGVFAVSRTLPIRQQGIRGRWQIPSASRARPTPSSVE